VFHTLPSRLTPVMIRHALVADEFIRRIIVCLNRPVVTATKGLM